MNYHELTANVSLIQNDLCVVIYVKKTVVCEHCFEMGQNRTFWWFGGKKNVHEKMQTRREKGAFLEKNDVWEVKKWLLNCKTIAFTLSFDSFYTLKA